MKKNNLKSTGCLCNQCPLSRDHCEPQEGAECLCSQCTVETDVGEDAPNPCKFYGCLSCGSLDFFKGKYCDECINEWMPEGRGHFAQMRRAARKDTTPTGLFDLAFRFLWKPSSLEPSTHKNWEEKFKQAGEEYKRPEPPRKESSGILAWYFRPFFGGNK